MKTISLKNLSNAQKQNFFVSQLKKRWWDVIFDKEKKTLTISTVGGREIIFNFSKNWTGFWEPFIRLDDLEKIINSSYEEYWKWYEENTISDDDDWVTYPLDSWEGFLDSPIGRQLIEVLTQINFWTWGESISFSWVSEEDTSSKFYSYCILDLIWLNYCEHNNKWIQYIIDCWDLVFPCDW